jgi:Fur family ferric uptake transcriptional regulator
MKQIHRQEKAQFKKLFEDEHIDRFEDRFVILKIFLQTESHVTVDELTTQLKSNGHSFNSDFVEDTLKLMSRFGFAQKIRFENGQTRYEHRHLGHHHDHMICTKCRKIVEFENSELENLQLQIASSLGFHMLQHRMEIYGICSKCLQKRVPHLPLTSAKAGEKLVIKDFSGGSKARMRLLSMGLRLDDQIEVITNSGKGQLVIAVDNKRYIIGRGLAEKLFVQSLQS